MPRPQCLLIHDGAGYSALDYWDGYDIVCGFCGYRVINPNPTIAIYRAARLSDGVWKWLIGVRVFDHYGWPEYILGCRGSTKKGLSAVI